MRGFVDGEVVEDGCATRSCMVLPSRREGYGMVVLEAASHGTPSVVVAAPDNAAVELIEEGVNGFVAASDAPEDLAAAILRVHAGRAGAARVDRGVVGANAERLSVRSSLDAVAAAYA